MGQQVLGSPIGPVGLGFFECLVPLFLVEVAPPYPEQGNHALLLVWLEIVER